MTRLAFIGSGAAVLLAATAVNATSLTAPSGGGYIAAFADYLGIGDQVVSGVGSAHYGPAFVTVSTATGASVRGSVPDSNVVTKPCCGGITYNAAASYTYYIELGGASLSDVPIDIHYALALDAGPRDRTSGGISVITSHGYGLGYNVGVGFDVLSTLDFATSSYFVAYTDTNAPIKISVSGSTTGGSFYVDPMVTLDPMWVSTHQSDASSLAFDFGGVPNMSVSAVPEPAAWTLMLVGFSALGVALRRRAAKTLAA